MRLLRTLVNGAKCAPLLIIRNGAAPKRSREISMISIGSALRLANGANGASGLATCSVCPPPP